MKANSRRWVWMGLTLALLGGIGLHDGWRVSPATQAKFVVSPVFSAPVNTSPEFYEEFIDPKEAQPSVHVSSIAELPDGRMAAAWYAGSREGARDVAIYLATLEAGSTNGWSVPRPIVTAKTAGEETYRYVKKVGNAVLFAGTSGQLHLLYVAVGFGGWSCSSLNLKTSSDGGTNWSRSRRLGLSPFLNISELVKNAPVALTDGGFVVPIYHELMGNFSELLWLRLGADGDEAIKTRVSGGRSAFQPALVALTEANALLLARSVGAVAKIHTSQTADGGNTWSALKTIDLPNSNSGLDAIRLADGRLLLAFNDTASGRDNLRLAISTDDGTTWQRAGTLEAEAGKEFSYPTVLQTRDGLIHVTYTWKRRGIKHTVFNMAWVAAQMKGSNE